MKILTRPFDKIFGFGRVFHKPALSDKRFALRNWLKNKRMVLWDDYRPVQWAASGVVPVATFLSALQGEPFEIQTPQNTHDGNQDFVWNRGFVMTAKEQGLFDTMGDITLEDIRHMKSRLKLFRFAVSVDAPVEVTNCGSCLARWLVETTSSYDARVALRPPPAGVAAMGAEASGEVAGLNELLDGAAIPSESKEALTRDVRTLGAVDVTELTREDWASLASWATLREMERRRILRFVPP